MADVRATIVVTSAVAVNLRELSRRMGKRVLDSMYTAALSSTGSAPATHYVSSGFVPDTYINAMTHATRLYNAARAAWEDDGDVFPFTQQQVTNALGNCTVVLGDRDPHAIIGDLGLRLVQ